jgi:hypothetical protein
MHLSGHPRSLEKRWYLGVLCRTCKTPILFARDFSDGKGDRPSAGKLVLTCGEPECRRSADYSNAKISRFQKSATLSKPSSKPTRTARHR